MTAPADPRRSMALLIGTSTYESEKLSPLPAVGNNLNALAAALRDSRTWGLAQDRCLVLRDVREPGDVLLELLRVAREPLDTLLVYFAGHGLIDPTANELVLATTRTTATEPRLTGLHYPTVRSVLRSRRARRLLVVLDCCFSGRAVDVMADPSSVVVGQLPIEGTYILASTDAVTPGKATGEDQYTAFTGGLLQVINGGVPGGRPFLTPGDLFHHTRDLMVGRGWPQPTQCHEDTIRELPLMRNLWKTAGRWLAGRGSPGATAPPHVPDRTGGVDASDLVVGAHIGVSAIRPRYGPGSHDSLAVLDAAIAGEDSRWLPGMELVRDVMTAMRREYGDGAATAAIVTGDLLSGVHSSVAAGAPWQEVTGRIQEQAEAVRHWLGDPAGDGEPAVEDLERALATALGDLPEAALVMSAIAHVGSDRVEITTGAAAELSVVSGLALDTAVLVPNAAARPVTFYEPYVLVAPEGAVPVEELQHIGWHSPAPLLIIAPRIDSYTVSALYRLFARTIAVVRPTDPAVDWPALCARAGDTLLPGHPLARASAALITPASTTITALPGTSPSGTGHVLVHAGPPGASGHSGAVRALTVARAAARFGVRAGGGATLYRAGRALGSPYRTGRPARVGGGRGAEPRLALHDGLLRTALAAPVRQLIRNTGQDPDAMTPLLDAALTDLALGFECEVGAVTDLCAAGVLDPVATLRGVVENATAAVSRYAATF
ncbi:caspase family protein [Streptomyces sp. NPDC005483]|uniref:caspase, EACC1-associated type n=1 Tax=Streptomyces sp. NPDC005483 TaxID=3154882 RepID=UPI0033B83010